jgi:hypothetical protein
MKVYHGTNVRFDRIDLSKCSPDNDFGKGFYVTAIKQHADQRAADIAERFGGEPVTMEFDFDDKYLKDSNYHTLVFDTPCCQWVEFVMSNRDRATAKPAHNFDIVAGPIADDRMRRQFDRYQMNEITMEQLLKKITYREPTHQIMLGTPEAIALIQPDNAFISEMEDMITNIGVALVNDFKMDIIEAMKIIYNSNIFILLTDREASLFEKPWQEIYEMLKKERQA